MPRAKKRIIHSPGMGIEPKESSWLQADAAFLHHIGPQIKDFHHIKKVDIFFLTSIISFNLHAFIYL